MHEVKMEVRSGHMTTSSRCTIHLACPGAVSHRLLGAQPSQSAGRFFVALRTPEPNVDILHPAVGRPRAATGCSRARLGIHTS